MRIGKAISRYFQAVKEAKSQHRASPEDELEDADEGPKKEVKLPQEKPKEKNR